MKGILLLSNYFEDIEGLGTLDLLRRAKLNVDTVSIDDEPYVTTQYNVKIVPDRYLKDIDLNEYSFLIVPGGRAVSLTHIKSEKTKKVIKHFYQKQALVAAICAAPGLLSDYLEEVDFTCFPSCETMVPKGNYLPNEKVVVRDNLITSKACGTTFEFAYEIVKYLKGEEQAKDLLKSVYYER